MAAQIARTYLEDNFVNLCERNDFAGALVSSGAERHLNIALHLNSFLVAAFEVPLGPEHIRVFPKYVFSLEHRNPIDVHGSLTWNE